MMLFLPSAKQCHVLLQTYFGDVRDAYSDLINMPFSGIGLDFIEGKETYHLIETYGFPQDKWLFAGLVNGKNIWKNHYGGDAANFGCIAEKRAFRRYCQRPVPFCMFHIR